MTTQYVWRTKRKAKKGVRYVVRWIEPGTCKNRGKTFRRLEDARAFESKLWQDLRNDEYKIPVKIGYDEWVDKHISDLKESPDIDLAPKTIMGHKEALSALGRICKPSGPGSITPKMIREYRKQQLSNGFAPRTINKHIQAIKSALSYAVRAEIISSNKLLGPLRLLLREEQKMPRILEVGEVIALLNVATDLRHKAAISLAYYHGLRRGEICFIRWEDIDFEEKRLGIISRDDFQTKKRTSRVLSLRQETSDLLQKLYQDRVNQYVFIKPDSFYWSFEKWFKRLVKKASLDKCTIHDLRKTCNTLMKDAGVSPEVAMQVLGHTTFMVNQKHYTGELTGQLKNAINIIPTVG